MSDKPLGRFCWHELMTTDPDAAREFYRRIIGWGTQSWVGQAGGKPYEMWMQGDMPVGGLMELPAPEVPACWLAYVSTPSLDDTLDKVWRMGGSVMNEMAVAEVGRFAVIADPQGGVIAVIESEGETPGHDGPPALGEFSWHELATTDADAALSFYMEVFGWHETTRMDMGDDMGFYCMFGRDGRELGGMWTAPPEVPTAWIQYMRVPDAKTAVEQVAAAGGQILNGPMEVPGGDLIAQCLDPQGVPFAVHAVKEE